MEKVCEKCHAENAVERYFCAKCGAFLDKEKFQSEEAQDACDEAEFRMMRILENLNYVPHSPIIWDDTINSYAKKVEQYRAMLRIPEIRGAVHDELCDKMDDFLELCRKPEFQIAFVGTIKTGKSTLINALLGSNYASMSVTPETAALTKFRSSARDYVNVTFYNPKEWEALWASRTSSADGFMEEYNELDADRIKETWIGHPPIFKEMANNEIKQELHTWSSSKSAEHFFVKEIEVGISSLAQDFPKQVVLVDTPGLGDPVGYRSEISKQYIRKANAVFVCVEASKLQKEEIETISSVFSFSSHNKSKVHIIATHWDKLNNPQRDWSEQKAWMEKKLSGKGFFGDEKLAHENIMYSAAYIYNLGRDFKSLSDGEKVPLMQFALQLWGLNINPLEETIPTLMELSNIDAIKKVINDKLAGKYQKLLYEDMEKKFFDIVYNLRRMSEENRDSLHEVIDTSRQDIQKMEEKLEKKRQDYEKLQRYQEQLTAALSSVKEQTNTRMEAILSQLDQCENEVTSKKKSKGKRQ